MGAGRGAAGLLLWISTSALPRRAALGHSLFPGARNALHCPGTEGISFSSAGAGGPGWAQMSLGPLAGQAGVPWQPFHGSPGAVHAVHGPGAQSCPGAAFQAQMTP